MTNYQKYQLQWMIDHECSLQDLIRELTDLQYSDPEDSDQISESVDELFNQWESDIGFGGMLWACKDEWEDNERALL